MKLVDRMKKLPVSEAIELVKVSSYGHFKGSIDSHFVMNVKNLRGLISLPHYSGKDLVVLAFGEGAEKSGADVVGDEAKLTELEKGKVNFDVMVVTPAWMPKLARLAKVLGPKGLMPNPKNGTIGEDLEKLVKEMRGGKMEYKSEKDGFGMHLKFGSLDQSSEDLSANLLALVNTIGKSRIKKLSLASTMGPGIKVDLSSF